MLVMLLLLMLSVEAENRKFTEMQGESDEVV